MGFKLNLGSLGVHLTANDSQFKTAMTSAKTEVTSVGKAFGILGGAGVAAGATLLALANHAAAVGDAAAKAAPALGMTASQYQEMSYAAQRAGTDITQISSAFRQVNRLAGEASQGVGAGADAYAKYSISLEKTDGSLKSANDLFREKIDLIREMPAGIDQTTAAQELLGKSYGSLLPLIQGGSAGLDEMTERVRRLGGIMSDEAAARAEAYQDAMLDLKTVLSATALEIGTGLMPAITGLTDIVTEYLINLRESTDAQEAFTGGIADGVAFLGEFIGGLGTVAEILGVVGGIIGEIHRTLEVLGQALAMAAQSAIATYTLVTKGVKAGREEFERFDRMQRLLTGTVKEYGSSIKGGLELGSKFADVADRMRQSVRSLSDELREGKTAFVEYGPKAPKRQEQETRTRAAVGGLSSAERRAREEIARLELAALNETDAIERQRLQLAAQLEGIKRQDLTSTERLVQETRVRLQTEQAIEAIVASQEQARAKELETLLHSIELELAAEKSLRDRERFARMELAILQERDDLLKSELEHKRNLAMIQQRNLTDTEREVALLREKLRYESDVADIRARQVSPVQEAAAGGQDLQGLLGGSGGLFGSLLGAAAGGKDKGGQVGQLAGKGLSALGASAGVAGAAGPVGMAIGAVVSVLKEVGKRLFDFAMQFESFSTGIAAIKNQIKSLFEPLVDEFSDAVLGPILQLFKQVKLSLSPLIQFSGLFDGIGKAVFNAVRGFVNVILTLAQVYNKAKAAITSIISSVASAIYKMFDLLPEWARWDGFDRMMASLLGLSVEYDYASQQARETADALAAAKQEINDLTYEEARRRSEVERSTRAFNELNESMSNIPQGFKVALRRFQATDGDSLSLTREAGLIINGGVTVVAPDPQAFLEEIKNLAAQGRFRQTGSTASSAPAWLGQGLFG
jgi:hypothetical protein